MNSYSQPRSLPFAHLNLRRNPFGEMNENDRAKLAVVDVDELLQKLIRGRFAVQFLGEKGFGKTTHLLRLRRLLPHSGYVHIPEGESRPTPKGVPVMIDEAQRLKFVQRRKLFRSDTPLVLGTHRDFSSQLRWAGRNFQTVNVGALMSEERLHEVLNARIEWVRRDAGDIPRVSQQTSRQLLEAHGPNVRGILRDLYVRFQNLSDIQTV